MQRICLQNIYVMGIYASILSCRSSRPAQSLESTGNQNTSRVQVKRQLMVSWLQSGYYGDSRKTPSTGLLVKRPISRPKVELTRRAFKPPTINFTLPSDHIIAHLVGPTWLPGKILFPRRSWFCRPPWMV